MEQCFEVSEGMLSVKYLRSNKSCVLCQLNFFEHHKTVTLKLK